jgi:hypothetical protein
MLEGAAYVNGLLRWPSVAQMEAEQFEMRLEFSKHGLNRGKDGARRQTFRASQRTDICQLARFLPDHVGIRTKSFQWVGQDRGRDQFYARLYLPEPICSLN